MGLLIHESEKLSKVPVQVSNEALLSRKSETKKSFKCHYCKKPNHYARDCYRKKADTKANDFVTKDTSADGKAELALKSSNPATMNDEWWIDSGASQHMTPERKSMMNYSRFEQLVKVKLSDDGVLHSYGKGDVSLTAYNDREKVSVLFMPKLQNKFFSLPSITEKGACVEFKGKSCKVTIEKEYVIGHKHGKLYKLNAAADETCCVGQADHVEPLLLWHQRYGHL